MKFTEGQTVVYPHHGPATVKSFTTKKVKGVDTRYVVLEVQSSNLVVSVPVENAAEVGVRELLTSREIDELLKLLSSPTENEESQWSRRLKANREKLALGNIFSMAEVVRDLIRRNEDKGLSLAEREMLRSARTPVTNEIALALDVGQEDAEAVVHFAAMCEPGTKLSKIRAARAELAAA